MGLAARVFGDTTETLLFSSLMLSRTSVSGTTLAFAWVAFALTSEQDVEIFPAVDREFLNRHGGIVHGGTGG
jgi:hypothetical protein